MLDNIIEFLQKVIIEDWVLFSFIIFFIIYGFIRGGAKIIIHGIWSLAGFFIATMFYQDLVNIELFDFISPDNQVILFINFIAIFIIFIILKFLIYKLLKIIANIHGPCPLNKFIAKTIGLFLAIALSWYITLDISKLDIISKVITNEVIRVSLSFIAVLTVIMVLVFIFTKLLHIKVGIDRPCPLLIVLQPLDGILNAKNINSMFNNFVGIIFALLKGIIILVLLTIINNHAEFIVYNTSGFIGYIQDLANDIQNIFNEYLSFIDKK